MKVNELNIVLLLLPTLVAFVFKLLFRDFNQTLFENLIMEALCYLVFVPLLFSNVIRSIKLKKYAFLVITSLSAFTILFKTVYYYMYGANIGPSTVFFILDTNGNEGFEFIKNSIDLKIISIIVLFAIAGYISSRASGVLTENLSKVTLKSNKNFGLIYCFFFITLLFGLYKQDQLRCNTTYQVIKSVVEYSKFNQDFKEIGFATKKGHFENVTYTNGTENETFVVIIGESTTSRRMSLYQYPNETNPELNEIKEELDVFTDVISPHVGTVLSLGKVLTTNSVDNSNPIEFENLGDLLHGKGFKKLNLDAGSILQLYNNAGFKTFWLSNQRPVGIYENLVTEIAKGADVQKFINVSNYDESTPFDGELLKPFEQALEDKAQRKVIFLHLLGTHMHYEYRYPEKFNHFDKEDVSFFQKLISKEKQHHAYAMQYDNAVRYNDHIIRTVIERLRSTHDSSFVLFFSDHGEDVEPKGDTWPGHNLEETSRAMFEIPFVLWRSPEFKKQHTDKTFKLDNKFMTDNLIHAMADLCNINYTGFKPEKSIFNEHFCETPRIVLTDKEFDKEFPQKEIKNDQLVLVEEK